MARNSIIECEGLAKRYSINHQAKQDTLRDALAHGAASWVSRLFGSSLRPQGKEEFWALRDVSFSVERGEVLGIIGRNGAGKSTLLKVLSRITEPTQGRIRMRGRVASLLEVGTGFHPELSGRDNIFLNGAILGMTLAEIRARFDEIVAFAEVDRFLDTAVKHYSSGMYVRLAFAVAAHLQPEILVVDEVLAVGDAQFQRKCLGRMKDVAANSGRTVLFVSHNLATVTSICGRCIWLDQGQVRKIGAADEVVAAYLQQFTPEHSLNFDLSQVARAPGPSPRLKITRLEFNAGQPISNREPLTARLEFVTTAAVEGVSLGVGFSTLDGTRLLSLDSDYGRERRDLPAGATGSISVRLPELLLGPGTYSIDVGARSGETAALDYLGGCGTVEVHAGPGVPPGFAMLGGGVRGPAAWSWSVKS